MSENSVYSVLACPSNSFPRILQWNQVLQWRKACFLTTGAKPVTLGVLTFGVSLGLLLLFVKVLLLESPPPFPYGPLRRPFPAPVSGLYSEAACWLLELFRQVPKCGPQASRVWCWFRGSLLISIVTVYSLFLKIHNKCQHMQFCLLNLFNRTLFGRDCP